MGGPGGLWEVIWEFFGDLWEVRVVFFDFVLLFVFIIKQSAVIRLIIIVIFARCFLAIVFHVTGQMMALVRRVCV